MEVDDYFAPRPVFDYEILPFPWNMSISSLLLPSPPPLRSSSSRPRRPPFRRMVAQINCLEPSNVALNNTISTPDLSPALTPNLPPTSLLTNDIKMTPVPTNGRNAPPTITTASPPTDHDPSSSNSLAISPLSNTIEHDPNQIGLMAVPPPGGSHLSDSSAPSPETSFNPPIGIPSQSSTSSSLQLNAAIISELNVTLDELRPCPRKKAEDIFVVNALPLINERMVYEKVPLQDEKGQPSVKRNDSMAVRAFKIRGLFKRRISRGTKDKPCGTAKAVRIPCALEIARQRAREEALLEGRQDRENANQKSKGPIKHFPKDITTFVVRRWQKIRSVIFGRRESKGKAFESYSGHDEPIPDRYKERITMRYNVFHMSRPPLDWDPYKATYAPGPASQCCKGCAEEAEKICRVLQIPTPGRRVSALAVLDSASASIASLVPITLPENSEARIRQSTQIAKRSGDSGIEGSNSTRTDGNSSFSRSLDGPSDSPRSSLVLVNVKIKRGESCHSR